MKKTKAKYIVTVLSLLSAACLSACSAKQPGVEDTASGYETSTRKPSGYDTPEAAVSAYLDGFKNMNLEQMMGTFAIENYVDNHDYERRINQITAYTYNLEIKLPNATPLATALNVESRRSNVSSCILKQYVTLAFPDFNMFETQALKTEEDSKEFADTFASRLKDLKVDSIKLLGFIPPEKLSDVYAMDQNLKNIAKNAEICGADKLESRVAVFELDGKEYFMCIDTANYGGKWYVIALGGNIGALLGIDSLRGGVAPLYEFESDLDADWAELMVPVS